MIFDTFIREQSNIDKLLNSEKFWKTWSLPKEFTNVIEQDFLKYLYEKYCVNIDNEQDKYGRNKTYFGGPGTKILKEVFPYIQKIYPHIKYKNVSASLLRIKNPSPLHMDGYEWKTGFPSKQLIIPIHIETENVNYKWAGTLFFKQHFLSDISTGIEWQLISDGWDKFKFYNDFKKTFGKGYEKLPTFYDAYGNVLDKHNNITCNWKHFGDYKLYKNNKIWLKGLDIDKYFNWIPGNIISFNAFSIHSGTNFLSENVKCKYGLRVNFKEAYD